MYLIKKITDKKSIKRQIFILSRFLNIITFPASFSVCMSSSILRTLDQETWTPRSPLDPGTVQGVGMWALLKNTLSTAMPSSTWLLLCPFCLLSYGCSAFCCYISALFSSFPTTWPPTTGLQTWHQVQTLLPSLPHLWNPMGDFLSKVTKWLDPWLPWLPLPHNPLSRIPLT